MAEFDDATMADAIDETIASDPNIVNTERDGFDMDSSYDSDSFRSMTSLTESMLNYRKICGRTYQTSDGSNEIKYWGPNDAKQIEGLDITHHWMTLLFDGKLYQAPIGSKPEMILDIGTGTGLWAIDVAEAHESAAVIGIDISPIQPNWVPPNCRFVIEDAEMEWPWDLNYFDFIHTRHLIGAISDWPRLYEQAFRHLRPGGWFEHCEYDITTRSDTGLVDDDHIFNRWCKYFFDSSKVTGRRFDFPRKGEMKKIMDEAGFVDVVHRQWKIPIGGWARDPKMKELGFFTFEFIDSSLEGFALFILNKIMEWEVDRIMAHVKEMQDGIRRGRLMPYFILHLVYGRKPEVQGQAAGAGSHTM